MIFLYLDGIALQKRHGGVLGLSGCILAYPYCVPDWMPHLLLEVGEHLHDVAQIEVGFVIHATLRREIAFNL